MSEASEHYDKMKEKDMNFFFSGGYNFESNQYFTFKHYLDDDNIVIITSNIEYWKKNGYYVMWVSNDKVVYLKDWQVKKVHNDQNKLNCYAVKLNRKYCKSYKLKFQNEKLFFDGKEDTFDSLLETAKEQDKGNMKIASSWQKDI